MPKQSYVWWLHELTPDQLEWIGRKAGRLSEMITAGIPVPRGFVLFPQAFYDFLKTNNLKSKIQSHISSVDPYNPADLEMAAGHIQSIIMNTPVPKDIALAVFQAVGQLGQHQTVAIRGSSSHSAFSTAHQQPKLAVTGDAAILDGIRQVWSQLLSPRNIQSIFHQSLTEYPFSIIVEQMIQSQVGGELFTADPSGAHKNTLYINAALGVRDEYIKRYNYPDLYVVDATNFQITEKITTPQHKALVITPHGISEETVFPPKNDHPKIADAVLIALSHLGKKIQSLYFFPQKIEFAIADNAIYILDTQPLGIADQIFRPSLDQIHPADQLEHLGRGISINPGLVTAPLRVIGTKNQIKDIKAKEIVSLPNTSLIRQIPLKNVGGLIIESASSTDVDIIYCKNVGIPCIIGPIDKPKNGTVVSLDATQGFVYLGSRQSSGEIYSPKTPVTPPPAAPHLATKLFISLTNPSDLTEIKPSSWAGIGMIRTEQIIQEAGFDPNDFFQKDDNQKFTILTDKLSSLMKSADTKPFIVRLNDPIPAGEAAFSITRGAIKYQDHTQSLETELSLLAAAITQAKPAEVKLVVPFVRDKAEIQYFLQVSHQILPISTNLQILSMIETPSAALCIDELSVLPIQGFVLGLNDLTAFTLAIDRSDPVASSLYHQSHDSVSKLIELVAKSANSHGKRIYVSGEGIIDSYDVLKTCLKNSISGLCIPAKRLPTLASQIAALELEMTKVHNG